MKPRINILNYHIRILLLISTISCTAVFLFISFTEERPNVFQVIAGGDTEYLVDTPGCKIPSLNPWDPSVKRFYRYSGLYRQCKGPPSFLRTGPNAVVSLDTTLLELYYELSAANVSCTYQSIYRSGNISAFTIDDEFQLGSVHQLVFDVPLNENHIKTICLDKTSGKEFVEYLPLTPLKPKVEKRCERSLKKSKLPNVLFLGIDSISRLNFLRHFPKTSKYLSDTLDPVSLDGYNKVGDNTFPNLVPLLTGHYYSYYWDEKSTIKNATMYFDDLDFLWKEFAKIGYRTMLAEDAPRIATFNYMKSGFKEPPTDYYLRPFSLALEYTKERYLQCFGEKMELSVIYQYLKNFVQTMNHTRPYFAFVFSARLTHDVFNNAGYADEPTYRLIRYLHEDGHLKNTVLVFYSDHGIRFSEVRNTYIGRFEERRPFMHLVFPEWFKKQYPVAIKNLRTNQKRLTTPFDIHETILDLRNMQKRVSVDEAVLKGPGISLFNEVSPHRTCEHATITPHWCTCKIHQSVSIEDKTVVSASAAVIRTINEWTREHRHKCTLLVLKKIHAAHVSKTIRETLNTTAISEISYQEYSVVLSVLPSEALFEATVRCYVDKHSCSVMDDISRINRYDSQSACIDDAVLKKYCYCK